jgi:prophage regulatory protein
VNQTDFLLRRKQVEDIVGKSCATIYRDMAAGKFPRPVSVGTGSVRWKQSTITAWLNSLQKTSGA